MTRRPVPALIAGDERRVTRFRRRHPEVRVFVRTYPCPRAVIPGRGDNPIVRGSVRSLMDKLDEIYPPDG